MWVEMKWTEWGFRPHLCTDRSNWARRTSWGWLDKWDDNVRNTEVKQRRARFIIGWVTAWDCQVLYTLVGLREPRKSDGSSDWPRVGRKRSSMDVGAVSFRRDPRKSTMCEYLAHKANLLGMRIAWCASMAAQLYISQETELEFEW